MRCIQSAPAARNNHRHIPEVSQLDSLITKPSRTCLRNRQAMNRWVTTSYSRCQHLQLIPNDWRMPPTTFFISSSLIWPASSNC